MKTSNALGSLAVGWGRDGIAAMVLAAALALTGCTSAEGPAPLSGDIAAVKPEAILEGDVLKLDFVGAPTLNTTQEVRRDGRISLPLVGEVVAAGLQPEELGRELGKRYASELLANQVNVTVISSAFDVQVSGEVLRPGKYASKHRLSALQAVMEAGGFNPAKANMKRVVVVRHEKNGEVRSYVLDLSRSLEGKQDQPFYLQSADIVYVPARFVWF